MRALQWVQRAGQAGTDQGRDRALPAGRPPHPWLFAIDAASPREKRLCKLSPCLRDMEVGMELRPSPLLRRRSRCRQFDSSRRTKVTHSSHLSVGKSAISNRKFGVQLMHRSAHGVELTSAGKLFLDHARMALSGRSSQASSATRSTAGEPTFALGFMSGPKSVCCPRWTASFATSFPASTSACRVTTPSARQSLDEAQA